MTLRELSQLYYLNREIEVEKERLEKLRIQSQKPPGAILSGAHGGTSGSRTEQYVSAISALEALLSEKMHRRIIERDRLERYIAEIPDSLTRQIFRLRFVDGLSWTRISLNIGGGNTVESIRKRVYRHLKSQNK